MISCIYCMIAIKFSSVYTIGNRTSHSQFQWRRSLALGRFNRAYVPLSVATMASRHAAPPRAIQQHPQKSVSLNSLYAVTLTYWVNRCISQNVCLGVSRWISTLQLSRARAFTMTFKASLYLLLILWNKLYNLRVINVDRLVILYCTPEYFYNTNRWLKADRRVVHKLSYG